MPIPLLLARGCIVQMCVQLATGFARVTDDTHQEQFLYEAYPAATTTWKASACATRTHSLHAKHEQWHKPEEFLDRLFCQRHNHPGRRRGVGGLIASCNERWRRTGRRRVRVRHRLVRLLGSARINSSPSARRAIPREKSRENSNHHSASASRPPPAGRERPRRVTAEVTDALSYRRSAGSGGPHAGKLGRRQVLSMCARLRPIQLGRLVRPSPPARPVCEQPPPPGL